MDVAVSLFDSKITSTYPSANETLPIQIYNFVANTDYSLSLDLSHYSGVPAYIKDNVTNTSTIFSEDNTTIS